VKKFTHPAIVAFGTATLCTLFLTGPLVSPTHYTVYHLSGSARSLFFAVGLEVGLLWIVLAGLLLLAEKCTSFRIPIWSGLILFLPWVLMKNTASLMGWMMPRSISLPVLLVPCVFSTTVFCLGRRSSFYLVFNSVQRLAATLLSSSAPIGVLVLIQLLWFGWQARNLDSSPQLHQRQIVSGSAASRTRIVWILFDELSYQQVYEQRFPRLQLPAFDRLAMQSTIFTHTIPAGIFTEEVVPSLMTGLPVDRLNVSADGQLQSLHNPLSGAWQAFDPHQTVFQDALNRGYSTAVVGWYNPYCRILSQVLDRCSWASRFLYPGSISSEKSIPANVVSPLRQVLSSVLMHLRFRPGPSAAETSAAEMHISDYRDLLAAGDTLLADPSLDFAFLHMPIPHPGGIYDRKSGSFTTTHSSYIDNLALADQYLDHVRKLLEQHGQWDSSAVIVMGDHSWRTKLIWSSSLQWTPEEQKASHGGKFDDRPAYIIKMPYKREAVRIVSPFAAIHTRALLDGIIENRLRTSDGLQTWVQQQR